jgi:hypothetical protein
MMPVTAPRPLGPPPGPARVYLPNGGPPRPGPVPTGAWQGALRPPVFVVNQGTRPTERPVYREPLPVRGGRVASGAGVGALWMLLFGIQAGTARAYAWLTIVAAVIAWVAIAVLARFGDRGAAVGAAAATGLGVAIAGLVVLIQAFGGHWLLW